MKGTIKARLIHSLGGYTQEEYERETRFRPEPEINEQRLYTATCFAQALIKKKDWDKDGNPLMLTTIKEALKEKLVDEIAQYAEFFGPKISDPEFYSFAMKIKVVKPENDQLP